MPQSVLRSLAVTELILWDSIFPGGKAAEKRSIPGRRGIGWLHKHSDWS